MVTESFSGPSDLYRSSRPLTLRVQRCRRSYVSSLLSVIRHVERNPPLTLRLVHNSVIGKREAREILDSKFGNI